MVRTMTSNDLKGDSSVTNAFDRRRQDREAVGGAAQVRLAASVLAGRLCDSSSGGLFLELAEDLTFEVEFQADGERTLRRARLIRSQRMAGGKSGWAVEFLD